MKAFWCCSVLRFRPLPLSSRFLSLNACLSFSASDTEDSGAETFPPMSPEAPQRIFYPVSGTAVRGSKTRVVRPWYDEDEMVMRVRSVLSRKGWDLEVIDSADVVLDDRVGAWALDDLFRGSSDATLAFFFFQRYRRRTAHRHGIQSACTMIHIAVSGDVNAIAEKLLRGLISKKFRGEERHALLFKALVETGRSAEVTGVVFSMLVSCLVRKGMVDVAMETMEWMRKFGYFASQFVYGSLIRALLESRRIETALKVFGEMQSSAIDPTGETVNLFIHKLCKSGEFGDAYSLLILKHSHWRQVDSNSWKILIYSLCKVGLLKEATAIFYKLALMGLRMDVTAYNRLIHGYIERGFTSKAYELKNLMSKDGLSPDIVTYNTLLHDIALQGWGLESFEVKELLSGNLNPAKIAFTNMIHCYCKKGNIEYARSMLRRMSEPDVVAYSVVLHALCKAKRMEYVKQVMNDGLKPDLILYNILIKGFGNVGDFGEVSNLLIRMKEQSIFPSDDTYNAVVFGLERNGVQNARKIAAKIIAHSSKTGCVLMASRMRMLKEVAYIGG